MSESKRDLAMAGGWLRRHPWSTALAVVMIAVALTGSGVTLAHHLPSPMMSGPVTAALPSPTPPPRPGFLYYTETLSSFQVQYPAAWQAIPQNPGVELDDSTANPAYIMQVLLPSDSQDQATDWVQYEFSNLSQQAGPSNFTQLSHPGQMTLNGIVWQTGEAHLQQGVTSISVLVLATVHNNRAYVINLLAANQSMAEARRHIFDQILETFAFLA